MALPILLSVSMNLDHMIQNIINIRQPSHDAGISMECRKDDFAIPTILEYNVQNTINVGVEIKVVVHLILSCLNMTDTYISSSLLIWVTKTPQAYLTLSSLSIMHTSCTPQKTTQSLWFQHKEHISLSYSLFRTKPTHCSLVKTTQIPLNLLFEQSEISCLLPKHHTGTHYNQLSIWPCNEVPQVQKSKSPLFKSHGYQQFKVPSVENTQLSKIIFKSLVRIQFSCFFYCQESTCLAYALILTSFNFSFPNILFIHEVPSLITVNQTFT